MIITNYIAPASLLLYLRPKRLGALEDCGALSKSLDCMTIKFFFEDNPTSDVYFFMSNGSFSCLRLARQRIPSKIQK